HPCWIRARSRPVGMCSRWNSCHGWKFSTTCHATRRPVAAAPLPCAQDRENLEAWHIDAAVSVSARRTNRKADRGARRQGALASQPGKFNLTSSSRQVQRTIGSCTARRWDGPTSPAPGSSRCRIDGAWATAAIGVQEASKTARSLAPAKGKRVCEASKVQKARAGRQIKRHERVADEIAANDTAFHHDRLGCTQTALAVLVVD